LLQASIPHTAAQKQRMGAGGARTRWVAFSVWAGCGCRGEKREGEFILFRFRLLPSAFFNDAFEVFANIFSRRYRVEGAGRFWRRHASFRSRLICFMTPLSQ